MIPLEKIKNIIDTYNKLEQELASGNTSKKDFVKKSKEYSSIGEIINEAIRQAYIRNGSEAYASQNNTIGIGISSFQISAKSYS